MRVPLNFSVAYLRYVAMFLKIQKLETF